MRRDSGIDGDAQRISQMVWMLFLKILADKETGRKTVLDDYKSPIKDEFKWQNWAVGKIGLTENQLVGFINNKLFPALKSLNVTDNPQARIIREVFENTSNYMKNGTLFHQVIKKINQINFNDFSESHLFNDIYETLLKELQSAGSAGEYYTPRAVTQFMTDIINPKFGEIVLDPACGTGGFLTCSINHLYKAKNAIKDRHILQSLIRGIEKKPMPHLLCTTNLMLHGLDVPTVRRDNYLNKPYVEWESNDMVDVILMNPPFGGLEEDGVENNFPSKFRTKETLDLFLVLIMRLLKKNGRAAVVVPDGILFGEGVKTRIKEELINSCNLHTIVRLPHGVFNPYTGIKTNLLFFKKGSPTKEIWYFEHPYPDGFKNYNKTNPIELKEFDLEKGWWDNRKENKYAWKISIEDIKKREYNLDIKNPHKVVNKLPSSKELLNQYNTIEKNIKSTQQNIIDFLRQSLDKDSIFLQQNFSNFFRDKKSIKQLREAIFQLAVQGKLTKKWRKDHPNISIKTQGLSKLLKIDANKLQIHYNGINFQIPSTWSKVKFSQLFDIKGGSQPVKSKFINNPKNGYVQLFQIRDFGNNPRPIYVPIDSVSKFCNSDDIMIGRYGASIGKVFYGKNGAYNVALVKLIWDRDILLLDFVYQLFNSRYIQKFFKNCSRSAQAGFNKKDVSKISIVIPPVEEQKIIVKKVKYLMTLCESLEEKVENSQCQKEKVMESSLTDLIL